MTKTIARFLIITVIFCCSLFLLSSCDKGKNPASSVPADFLPKEGDIEGWSKGSADDDYREATDYSSLYDIIDGGAEIYINHGFIEGVHQNYYGSIQGSEQILQLLIYDMGDSSNAYNLFHDPAIVPTSHSLQDYGDEGRLDEGALFDYVLDFRLNRYYVELTLNKEGLEVESLQMLRLFASAVESNMEN